MINLQSVARASPRQHRKQVRAMRPVRPSRRIEVAYRAKLLSLVALLKKQVAQAIYPLLLDLEPSYAKDEQGNWADKLKGAFVYIVNINRNLNPWAQTEASRLTSTMITSVDKSLAISVKQSLKVDITGLMTKEGAIREAMATAVKANVDLITSIPEQYLEKVQNAVFEAMTEGKRHEEIIKEIERIGGVTESRAQLIARDQVGKLNSDFNRVRQTELGIEEYTWQTAGDERVRDEHADLDGQVFRWDDPPPDGHPGEAVQCFPGSVNVSFPNGYNKLWRHWYSGSLSSIVTSDGVLLESTPNHPVLTLDGWIPLGRLQEGNYVVQAVGYGSGINEIDVTDGISRFEKVFDLACLNVPAFRRPAARFNFHGETPQNDVDAVTSSGNLSSGSSAESICEFNFTKSDVDVAEAILNLPTSKVHRSTGFRATSNCFIGFGCERLSVVVAQLRHANKVCARSVSNWKSGCSQDSGDDIPCDAVISGQLQNARAVQICGHDGWVIKVGSAVMCGFSSSSSSIDIAQAEMLAEVIRVAGKKDAYFLEGHAIGYKPLRVIQKGAREFSDHVFNAETSHGWYVVGSNAIVSHNCRCVAAPIFKLDNQNDTN